MSNRVNTNEININILNYILGGKATFCIYQEASEKSKGGKAWYRVSSNNGTAFFVNYFQDKKEYYLGYFLITDLANMTALRISKKKAELPDANLYAKPLLNVLRHLYTTDVLPGNGIVHVISDGRCSVCGRKLTDFESMNIGIGPTCREKLKRR